MGIKRCRCASPSQRVEGHRVYSGIFLCCVYYTSSCHHRCRLCIGEAACHRHRFYARLALSQQSPAETIGSARNDKHMCHRQNFKSRNGHWIMLEDSYMFEGENNEKQRIPDKPPQQHTQGKISRSGTPSLRYWLPTSLLPNYNLSPRVAATVAQYTVSAHCCHCRHRFATSRCRPASSIVACRDSAVCRSLGRWSPHAGARLYTNMVEGGFREMGAAKPLSLIHI